MQHRAGFGQWLRALRDTRGLTQEELAEASGSSVRTIREMERGRVRTPQRRTVALLADALGLAGADRDRFVGLARAGHRPQPDPGIVAASPVVPSELPAAVPNLVGREAELTVLARLTTGVTDGSATTASVVVLHGPPGTGKSSLAVAAGHRLGTAFTDGQLFLDLHGTALTDTGRADGGRAVGAWVDTGRVDTGRTGGAFAGIVDPAEALAGLLRSLGVPEEAIPGPSEQRGRLFRTLTRDRRLLIVVDDAADEAQVRPLLPAGRHCLTLVTSRRPLTGLTGAVRVPVGLLAPDAAWRLLASITGEDRLAADPTGTAELVELCGRLPLAIRVAGNRLASRPGWPVAQLVAQLADPRRRLTALTAGDLDVRATFDVSYRRLGATIAGVFRRASLVPGAEFDAGLLAAVTRVDVESAAAAAEELVDAGLLLPRGDRYAFHGLTRIYARERLALEE
ncbi:helix-turn-helix domain-containing protein [Micromonospora sp. NBRC 110038]|uniref:helix-turn-helix domain-containing protein n=1 Tax=Micromonospora sp. NBRC 110038 TaxID=1550034 RepID=UPI001E291004|nr:helix-turn-helix domain-containing protein [Micromonospora sp. NBRC 110038]